ncbi:MAG: hypothetical protein ABUS56_09195, partial [Acidobacteriota bacterium]
MTPTDTAGDGTAAPTAVSPLGTATLAVFFSRGMSLEGWRRAGILEREMALYMELARVIGSVMFVTYGGAAD